MAKKASKKPKSSKLAKPYLDIVERATGGDPKKVLGMRIASSLVKNSYSPVEKATIRYILKNYKFDVGSEKLLTNSIAPKKQSAGTKKTTSNKLPKKEQKKIGSTGKSKIDDEDAPTPEYHELIELDRYAKRQESHNKPWTAILVLTVSLGILFFLLRFFLANKNPDKVANVTKSSNSNVSSSSLKKESASPAVEKPIVDKIPEKTKEFKNPPKETKSNNPIVIDTNPKPEDLKFSRRQALHLINQAQIRFVRQTLDFGPGGEETLRNLAVQLVRYPEIRIRIKGHTCFVGELQENMLLSESRAKLIYESLIRSGVNASRLEFRGYGETTNIDSNYTDKGRRSNRRVDFTVLSIDSN